MPSQEDYLDRLLRNVGAEVIKGDTQPEEAKAEQEPVGPEAETAETGPEQFAPEPSDNAMDLEALLSEVEAETSETGPEQFVPELSDNAVDLEALLSEVEAETSESGAEQFAPELSDNAADLDAPLPEVETGTSETGPEQFAPELSENTSDLEALLSEVEAETSETGPEQFAPELSENAADLEALLSKLETETVETEAEQLIPEPVEGEGNLDVLLPEQEMEVVLPESYEMAENSELSISESEMGDVKGSEEIFTESTRFDDSPVEWEEVGEDYEPEQDGAASNVVDFEDSMVDIDSVLSEVEGIQTGETGGIAAVHEDVISDMGLMDESENIDALAEGILSEMGLSDAPMETDSLLEDGITEEEMAEALKETADLLDDLVAQQEEEEEHAADPVEDVEKLFNSVFGLEPAPKDDLNSGEDDYQAASDLDALNSMSEDDIEQILSAGAGESEEFTDEVKSPEDDVLGMLEDSDDGDLQEIHQLLDRADNNEAVNEDIVALLQDTPPEENLEEKLLGEASESMDPKAMKAKEKERKRQEKAAAKQAAKEEKAAAKQAAKEAKAAAKEAKAAAKSGKAGVMSELAPEPKGSDEEALKNMEETKNVEPTAENTDDFFDASILDSIVSEAEQAGSENQPDIISQAMANGSEDDIFGNSNLFGSGTVGGAADSGAAGGAGSDGGLGFSMDDLFGDSNDSGLGAAAVDPADLANFPDFVDVDAGNADNLGSGTDDGGKKKRGLLARLFDFLTEEDEEEEGEGLQLSDENREILNDLDKEKTTGKKKKKGKKGAAKDGEGGEEKGKGKGKPKKEKKPKKPKPEKPKKEKVPEPEPLIPERKLTLKRILPVILACASLAVLILVFTNASVNFTEKQVAREAYYNGDYQTCYQNLYGKDLNETEQIMFGTSESIMRIRLWLSEYEMFVNSGEELKALDALIMAVKDYPKLYAYAVQWNAGDEVQAGYEHLLTILAQNYGLTEEQALEISNARSDIEYTRMVLFIVEGRGFGSWNESDTVTTPSPEPTADSLPDELPEEGELNESNFIDSQR